MDAYNNYAPYTNPPDYRGINGYFIIGQFPYQCGEGSSSVVRRI